MKLTKVTKKSYMNFHSIRPPVHSHSPHRLNPLHRFSHPAQTILQNGHSQKLAWAKREPQRGSFRKLFGPEKPPLSGGGALSGLERSKKRKHFRAPLPMQRYTKNKRNANSSRIFLTTEREIRKHSGTSPQALKAGMSLPSTLYALSCRVFPQPLQWSARWRHS